jgi:hypothetical protein
MPFRIRKGLTSLTAEAVYWPLARAAKLGDRLGLDTDAFPLSAYKDSSFYTMRMDSLNRFGSAFGAPFLARRNREDDARRRIGAGAIL